MAIEIEIEKKPSVRLSKVAVSETHGEDSPYFAGWKAYDENPYHETCNPSGVIQMGLAENQVILIISTFSSFIASSLIVIVFNIFFFIICRFHLIC